MPNRSSNHALATTLIQIAKEHQHEQKGFGGFPTTALTLRSSDYLRSEFDIEEIKNTLKVLHLDRRIFMQHWDAAAGCWAEWSSTKSDSFFSDFRLLPSDPRRISIHA